MFILRLFLQCPVFQSGPDHRDDQRHRRRDESSRPSQRQAQCPAAAEYFQHSPDGARSGMGRCHTPRALDPSEYAPRRKRSGSPPSPSPRGYPKRDQDKPENVEPDREKRRPAKAVIQPRHNEQREGHAQRHQRGKHFIPRLHPAAFLDARALPAAPGAAALPTCAPTPAATISRAKTHACHQPRSPAQRTAGRDEQVRDDQPHPPPQAKWCSYLGFIFFKAIFSSMQSRSVL